MEADAVLKMEIIAEHIFNFLSVEDLKRARLVCLVWKCEGARQILVKGYFRVPPGFHKEKSSKLKEKEKRLIFNFLHPQKLEDGVVKSRLRKVPNIWLTDVKDVKVLYDLGVESEEVGTLRFPNWNEAETDQESKKIRSLFKNMLSSHLTSLSAFYFNESTPALTRDTPIPLKYLEDFSKLGKGHLIKSLSFNFSPLLREKKIKRYENFLDETPDLALESLAFGQGLQKLRQKQPALFIRAIKILNRILKSSATSLRKLQVTDTLAEVNELEIPTLPNLETLTVFLPYKNQSSNLRVFPENISDELTRIFPNLSKVTLGIFGNDWMGCRVFQKIILEDKEKLLPGLNPELKFSVYEYNNLGLGKNHLLVSPPDSIPDQLSVDLMSEQVETPELNEEQRRMSYNIDWWSHFVFDFFICLMLVVSAVALIFAYARYVSSQNMLDEKLGEWRHQIWKIPDIVEGKTDIPSTVCVGTEHTWKIPPIYACPKNILDKTTTSFPTWAQNLHQFTCQQAAMYSSSTKFDALELFGEMEQSLWILDPTFMSSSRMKSFLKASEFSPHTDTNTMASPALLNPGK